MELDVREDNHTTIRVYQKSEFIKEGISSNGFLVDGKNISIVLMGEIL